MVRGQRGGGSPTAERQRLVDLRLRFSWSRLGSLHLWILVHGEERVLLGGGVCVCVCVCKCERERERERGKNKGMEVAEFKGPSWGRRQGEWASHGEVVQGGVGLVGVTEPGEGV